MKIIILDKVVGDWGADDEWLRMALDEANGDDIKLEISSPGGFVYPGLAMFNLLKNYKGNVQTHIMGLAASMASYIALAGDRVTAESNAVFMIHNVQGLVVGDHNDMQESANIFKRLSNLLAKAYADKSGKNLSEIKQLMDDSTYYFGNEIQKNGFVDEIIKSGKTETKDDAIAYAQLAIEECTGKMKSSNEKHDLFKAAALLEPMNYDLNNSQAQIPALAGKNIKTGGVQMTLEELKAQFPSLYNDVFQAGKNAGMEEMQKNIEAHLEWIEADPQGVVTALKNKEQFTMKHLSAYNKAATKNSMLNNRAVDDPKDVQVGDDKKKDFAVALDKSLEEKFGLKPEGGK